jgi:hypothetical protein
MYKYNRLFTLTLLLLTIAVRAQYTDQINSNRPGESQSPFAVGKSVIQVEAGCYGIQENHSIMGTEINGVGTDLNLRYGAIKEELEFNVKLQYQFDQYKTPFEVEKRNALKQAVIGAKYLIYDPSKNYEEKKNVYSWKAKYKFKWRQFIPSVAAFAGVNVNVNNPYTFKSDPKISPKVMLITQNQFTGGMVLVTNIIADKITTEYPSYGYVLTLTKGFNEQWSGFVENQGYKSEFYSDAILRGGAACLIGDDIQIDASIGTNFKETPSLFYGGVGISWRFDGDYSDVMLRIQKAKVKGKKDKKKKKKTVLPGNV